MAASRDHLYVGAGGGMCKYNLASLKDEGRKFRCSPRASALGALWRRC
jgi:hypothetical protein